MAKYDYRLFMATIAINCVGISVLGAHPTIDSWNMQTSMIMNQQLPILCLLLHDACHHHMDDGNTIHVSCQYLTNAIIIINNKNKKSCFCWGSQVYHPLLAYASASTLPFVKIVYSQGCVSNSNKLWLQVTSKCLIATKGSSVGSFGRGVNDPFSLIAIGASSLLYWFNWFVCQLHNPYDFIDSASACFNSWSQPGDRLNHTTNTISIILVFSPMWSNW